MGRAPSKGEVVTLKSYAPGSEVARDDLAVLLETDLDTEQRRSPSLLRADALRRLPALASKDTTAP
ncbi:hypothetical protein ACRAWC_04730 [Leifsonia sp. L25]|uniref:hypothetical protein n=1 Tax=Actinomycetes TaxID=1760 RepID=UPI003D69292B